MRPIFSFSVPPTKSYIKAGCLFLVCTLACLSSLSWASAQDNQQEVEKPVITVGGDYTEWVEGPGYRKTTSRVTAPDGSGLVIYDYFYKSGKRFKARLEDCRKDASRVVEDSVLLDARGRKVGRRTLVIFSGGDGRESAVLCRSKTSERSLTMIYGTTIEHVLGFERSGFPK